ncbi:MAG TPA: hypothetical protein VJR29_05875 [bacterium]|nr:hypothetical protein [bacterium]
MAAQAKVKNLATFGLFGRLNPNRLGELEPFMTPIRPLSATAPAAPAQPSATPPQEDSPSPWPKRAESPGRWQFQAAPLVGAALERETKAPDLAGTYSAGAGFGVRYFSPKYLGPLGFGLSGQYWWVGRSDGEDGENLAFSPTVGVRPVDPEIPFDVSAGPLLGFTEPLPSSGEVKFTTGASVALNIGAPSRISPKDFNFSLDVLNLTASFLARPFDEANRFGGTCLLGINPLGLVNGISWLFWSDS